MLRYMCASDTEPNSALDRVLAADARLPPGPREIYDLCSITGLVQLCDPSRLSPLILAGKATCEDSRALAIMSVVGATEWFKADDFAEFRTQGSDNVDMVFDLYPVAFIKEIRKIVGGHFFLCASEASTLMRDSTSLISVIQGSMLPFTPNSAGRHNTTLNRQEAFQDHPTVGSWTLAVGDSEWIPRGGVFIPEAAIVASNMEDEDGDVSHYEGPSKEITPMRLCLKNPLMWTMSILKNGYQNTR